MPFEAMHNLNVQLSNLLGQAKRTKDRGKRARINTFVKEVVTLVEAAYDDVHNLLASIAFYSDATISPEKIADFQARLNSTYSSTKFRDLLKICQALGQLSSEYIADICSVVPEKDRDRFDRLFSLLAVSEGEFKTTIEEGLWEISSKLDGARETQDPNPARAAATEALRDLEKYQQEVGRLRASIRGVTGGPNALLDIEKEATIAIQTSPWYSGSFFLGTALLLLTGLTVVMGRMPLRNFAVVVVGTYVGLVLIATFTLFRDGQLSEQGLTKLVQMAMIRVLVPVMGKAK
jgi:hypothetical protein